MRGGFLHNHLLIPPFRDHFMALGADVRLEHPAPNGGFVDLLAVFGPHRAVVEAELTPRRVPRDLAKARALNATFVLIVTPTPGAARLCRGAARGLSPPALILPLGPAIHRVRHCFPMPSNAIDPHQ